MRGLTVLSNDKQEPVSVWKAGNGEIHIQPFPHSYLCVFIKRLITFILLSFDIQGDTLRYRTITRENEQIRAYQQNFVFDELSYNIFGDESAGELSSKIRLKPVLGGKNTMIAIMGS